MDVIDTALEVIDRDGLEALGFEHLSGYGLAETASILTNQPQGKAVIGTAEDCHIRLFDAAISSRHAEIVIGAQNRFRVNDLGSRNGTYVNAEGSMSKLKAGRVAVWVTERAIQILGGYGYTREYGVERMHRDAKIFDIYEGTEQIQQLVISRAISGLRIE